jgi:hypothetical protein
MKNVKIYNAFKGKADQLMKFQLCRAYLNENCGVIQIVEKILMERFHDLSTKERVKIRENHGKSNPVIEIPRLDFKATVNEIINNYIEIRFDKMVAEVLAKKNTYPLTFRDIIERNMN